MKLSNTMYFLEQVAQDLLKHFGTNMSQVTIVFPNKRAGLFLNDYLASQAGDKPIWAPRYQTISELFNSLSPLKSDDDIETICRLWQIYCKHTKSSMSLDQFYGWGAQLMSDFNNIDQHMVDAKELFSLAHETREFDELDPKIAERLRQLFSEESRKGKEGLQKEFRQLWAKLYDIYTDLQTELKTLGCGYSGQRMRGVVESLKKEDAQDAFVSQLDGRTFVFVGFNILLTVEHELMLWLKQRDQARFYWDYDNLLLSQVDGIPVYDSIKANMEQFPNALPVGCFNNMSEPKTIEIASASSQNGQARYVSQWLKEHHDKTKSERRTAVVLCDESIMQPVMYSLPSDAVSEVNITKGFPTGHTIAYSFLDQKINEIVDKQTTDERHAKLLGNKAYQPASNLQILQDLSQSIEKEAKKYQDTKTDQIWLNQLNSESFYLIYTIINRFIRITENGLLNIQLPTLVSLLKTHINSQQVPFHGEPASGLQVIGVLETRNLDFDNVLMLGVNEGTVPRVGADNSFIPYHLRRYYKLTTSQEESQVYAYNFFRLLQRSKHITMTYSECSTGDDRKSLSRFVLQLLANTDLPIRQLTLKEGRETELPLIPSYNSKDVQEKLDNLQSLSPSSLNSFIQCKLKFYLSSVCNIKAPAKKQAILQANTLGSIFHDAATRSYLYLSDNKPLPQPIDKTAIKKLVENEEQLKEIIKEAFVKISKDDGITYDINEHPIEEMVVLQFLKDQLNFDAEEDDLRILLMEERKNFALKVNVYDTENEQAEPEEKNINVGGYIDRLDVISKGGVDTVRISDYKSGSYNRKDKMEATNMDNVFSGKKDYLFQTMLYCLLCEKNNDIQQLIAKSGANSNSPIAPALFFTKAIGKNDYSPYLKIGDDTISNFQSQFHDEFWSRIQDLVESVYTSDFTKDEKESHCTYCDFKEICNIKEKFW